MSYHAHLTHTHAATWMHTTQLFEKDVSLPHDKLAKQAACFIAPSTITKCQSVFDLLQISGAFAETSKLLNIPERSSQKSWQPKLPRLKANKQYLIYRFLNNYLLNYLSYCRSLAYFQAVSHIADVDVGSMHANVRKPSIQNLRCISPESLTYINNRILLSCPKP